MGIIFCATEDEEDGDLGQGGSGSGGGCVFSRSFRRRFHFVTCHSGSGTDPAYFH